MVVKVVLMASKRFIPTIMNIMIPKTVYNRYIHQIVFTVLLMLGFIFSSRASDLYRRAAAVPGRINIPITTITTPSPPTHCMRLLRNRMDLGSISKSV